MRPTRWPVFFGTRGDIEVNVTVPGFAVRIEIPREFVPVSAENDTSFVWSTITEDYWYYNVTDESRHFPYDPNAPWYVIVWSWNLTGFTPSQIVRFKDMVSPSLAGLYNVTTYVATSLSPTRKPIFPTDPTDVLTILVSRSRDWATVYGYTIDEEVLPKGMVVKTKGVVYAFNVDTRQREARALLNVTTGFFNLTGLRPGRYFFEACAGYFSATGFAYALTDQSRWYPTPIQLFERGSLQMNMTVDRGARISGSIRYQDSETLAFIPSLSHPWLTSLGYSAKGILNWTVEARDPEGKLVAMDFSNTLNLVTGDPFLLIVGKGRKYVGVDPINTEFCGIGLGRYNLAAYVFAYVQKQAVLPVQISWRGQDASRDIYVRVGGVISGTIRFTKPKTPSVVLETPNQAEMRVLDQPPTGLYFGGNILVEAYRISDWSLNGIFIRNGTSSSGVTLYADKDRLKFHILGFTEYYNRTYSGVWRQRDYGLDGGSYALKVRIRGYIQATYWNATLQLGSNQTVSVDMKAGGAIKTSLISGFAWPCTMRMQMSMEWIFLRSPMPYRARIYYYDENGASRGYTETVIALGQSGVQTTTLKAVFSGMNYDLAEMIYWGEVPTVISPGSYTMKAFTYGYVQADWPSVYTEYYCPSAGITMLIGGTVNCTAVLTRSGLFYGLVENVSYRADVFSGIFLGGLVGGQIGNGAVGESTISFSCRGFGGQGHFFFVTPDGVRHYDYGLGKGNFILSLRRFGYLYRFKETSISFGFPCLGFEVGCVWKVPLLNKIYGVVYGLSEGLPYRRPLSWATINVVAFGEVSMSLDGSYWVFMPDGESVVYFSIVGYEDRVVSVVASGGAVIELPPFELNPAPI